MASMAEQELNPTARFSNRVAYYVKYRPSYPRAVLAVLAAEINLSLNDVIADLGSGTGISAQLFLEHGNTVYGVEPNREMRAAAEEFLQTYPNFYSIDGSAEATTLPAQSIDVVIAAQAFHWFNVETARAEAKRILKTGGWGVLLWNDRLTAATPFLRAFEDLLLRYSTDYTQVNHRNAKDVDRQAISRFFGHDGWRLQKLPNQQSFDYEGLLGRLLSSSYAPLADHPNYEPMLGRLQEIFAEHQQEGLVRFEYETQIFYGQLA
jgi:ubiquinone/menaquinone biosynthesis C-methylase UbiE